MSRLNPWKLRASFIDRDYRIFKVKVQYATSPRTGRSHAFYTLETPDWANVIPITDEGLVVMIRQFRHGQNRVCLEIPGGLVERDETPQETAIRELEEETGYVGGTICYLGALSPNPALFDNRLHCFVAEGVRSAGRRKLDEGEDIEVVLVPLNKIGPLIQDGTIDHALV
ncbi:MAG: NUDIX hydrolase, partial [Candidatus Bathyarchaeia archaeon]